MTETPARPTGAPPPLPRKMRILLGVMTGIGILIILGFVVVIVEVINRVTDSGEVIANTLRTEQAWPQGAEVEQMVATEDRVFVHVSVDGQDRVLVLDGRDGRVLRDVTAPEIETAEDEVEPPVGD